MIKQLWRQAHLWLAVVTVVFLLIASLTGVVLAVHAVNERESAVRMPGSNELPLGEFLAHVHEKHPGLTSISINKHEQLIIETMDEEMKDQRLIIHPNDGSVISIERTDPPFIQWTLSLHRSLFLHETGRFIVGVVSFLFILINISGVMLILRRHKKIGRFFRKPKGSTMAKWHVRLGQYFFIPLLITALSGTYLFMKRFQLLPEKPAVSVSYASTHDTPIAKRIALDNFPAFQNIPLSDFRHIAFPFFDDPDEPYLLRLTDRELTIHPYSGTVITETRYPFHTLLGQVSFDLHTGTKSTAWALVLAVASLSIVGFVITGFAITFKKMKKKKKKKKKGIADAKHPSGKASSPGF